MKKILTTLVAALIVICTYAQSVPQGMKYQAVARDIQGQILSNHEISLLIELVLDGENKKVSYAETHQVRTNNLGLFDIVIGEGQSTKGDFQEIPWSENEIWMQISLDEQNTGEYTTISSSKLLAVPYAFHAGSAEKLSNETEEDRNGGIYWHILGNSGTVPGITFIGTTDFKDLVFKTNSTEGLRITATQEVQMDGDLSVGNNALIGNDLEVNNDATIDNDLDVGNDLNVDGIARFNNTTESTTKDNGAVIVEGGVGVEKNVNIGGNLDVTGTSKHNSQVTIDVALPDAAAGSDYDNYPLLVQGSAQGIAVSVEDVAGANSGRSNNYISFWKGTNNMKGRIEGTNFVDLDPTGLTGLIFSDFFNTGNLGSSFSFDLIDIISVSGNTNNFEDSGDNVENTVPSQTEIDNFNAQVGSDYVRDIIMQTIGVIKSTIMFAASVLSVLDPEDVFSTGVDLLTETVNIGIFIVYAYTGVGVAYESGSGDYAEWLERDNHKEVLTPGEVVGIRGGKISKEFEVAEKFMVISTAPAVLGNMPENAEMESVFEKVAFMGQVPVKVIGEVKKGDYILPSGNEDGFAMAVHPDDMQAKDFSRIVGIAWEESDGKKAFAYVKTAVGINANDTAKMLEEMQALMNEMQLAIQEVNPNYEPQLYNISSRPNLMSDSYSMAPTMSEHIISQLNISEDATLEDKMAALKQYAYDNGAGEYLEQFPYFFELLENPHDMELVNKVIDEYTVALQNAQTLISLTSQR